MNWWLSNKECTGCLACENICKNNAITVSEDEAGFLFPVFDASLCVNCGACKNVCPVNKVKENGNFYKDGSRTDVYAGWNNDSEIRMDSTSGGIFSVLAARTIEEGGMVVGAVFNKELNVENVLIKDMEDLAALRRSKYVSSNPKHIYREVKEAIENGKNVLFCGTPCEVAAAKAYIGDSDNLLLVDFVCRNTNAPIAYRSYLRSVGAHKHAEVIEVAFREKDDSWQNYSTRVTFDDGSRQNFNRYEDPFMKGFVNDNLYMRESCSDCKFRGFNRGSDITLGDYWGVREEWDDKKGTSLIIVHTEKGHEVIEAIKGDIVLHKSNAVEAAEKNRAIEESVKINTHSKEFIDRLNKGDDFIRVLDEFEKRDEDERKEGKKVSVYIFGHDEEKRKITRDSLNKSKGVTVELIEDLDNPNDMDEFLSKATGSLVSFLEEGDTVHIDTYEQAFKNAEAGADVSLFGIKEVIADKATWPVKSAFNGEGNELFLYDSLIRPAGKLSDYTSYGDFLCNKVYRKSVFNGVKLGIFDAGYKELCLLNVLLTARPNIHKVIGMTRSFADRPYRPYRIGEIDVKRFTDLIFNISVNAEPLNNHILNAALMYAYKYEKEIAKQMEYRGFDDVKKKLHIHMETYYPTIVGEGLLMEENLKEIENDYIGKINEKLATDKKIWEYKCKYNDLKNEYDIMAGKRFVKMALKADAFIKKIKGIFGFGKKK